MRSTTPTAQRPSGLCASDPRRLVLHAAASQGGTRGDMLEMAREEASSQRRQAIKALVPSVVSVQTTNRFLENHKHAIRDGCVFLSVHTQWVWP